MPTLLSPEQLSEELRTHSSPDMQRRRWTIGLSLANAAIGGVVAAYQTGMVKRLPDILPGPVWDAEKVDASRSGYSFLQMPDALQMTLTYATTAAIVGAGGANRAEDNPALPIAAAVKTGADLAIAAGLAVFEWRANRKLCSWCQVATILSAAAFALTLPEARRAVRAIS